MLVYFIHYSYWINQITLTEMIEIEYMVQPVCFFGCQAVTRFASASMFQSIRHTSQTPQSALAGRERDRLWCSCYSFIFTSKVMLRMTERFWKLLIWTESTMYLCLLSFFIDQLCCSSVLSWSINHPITGISPVKVNCFRSFFYCWKKIVI